VCGIDVWGSIGGWSRGGGGGQIGAVVRVGWCGLDGGGKTNAQAFGGFGDFELDSSISTSVSFPLCLDVDRIDAHPTPT